MSHVSVKILWVLFLAIILPSGCTTTGREARQAARETLAQLNTYESELDKKINAEMQFYKRSNQTIQRSLSRSSASSERSLLNSLAADFAGKSIASGSDISSIQLGNFIQNAIVENRQAQENFAGTSRKYNEELLNSLSALSLQEDSITKVRKGLEQLQSDQNTKDSLKEWFNFGQATKEEFDKLKQSKK
jgi:hypothetical protein